MRPRELAFNCVVKEKGSPCTNGILVPMKTVESEGIGASRHICKKHWDQGYRWMHSLLADPTLDVSDVARMQLPKRAKDLFLVKGSSNKAASLMQGYGTVEVFYAKDVFGNSYIEDVLLLPLEDAKDPKAPTVTRKDRTVGGGGFASPPEVKDE